MRVLLIEDDLVFGKQIKRFLSQTGHIVDWVQNGIDANAAHWATKHLDIVILDLDVPAFSWRDWLNSFKALSHGIPTLALTANDVKREVLNAGVNAYLCKRRFKQEKLLTTIHGLLLAQTIN